MRTAAALLFALLIAAPASAEDNAVALTITPPGEKLVLAEPFRFKLEASVPDAYVISPDTAAAGNPEFEVVSFTRTGQGKVGSRRRELFEVEAKPFTLGISTFPALAWNLRGPGVPEGTVVKTSTFTVEVLPAFEKTDGDIKDIYEPFGYIPWLLLLALAALAALTAFVYRRIMGGKQAPLFSRAPWHDARNPYQRARDRLDRLAKSPLAAAGRMKEFYTGFTSVLRLYLQEEFAIDAALMTSSDLGRELKRTGVDLKTALKAREFLQRADLVKFARMKPGEPEAAADASALAELLIAFHQAAENARALAAAEAAAEEARKRGGGRP